MAYIPVATAPTINRGPELFVNDRSRSPSCFEIWPEFLRSTVIFAPTGYPLVIPMATAKEPQPGTLKRGLIIGSKRIPAAFIKLVLFNSSDAAKKGNNEGKTMLRHIFIPFKAEDTDVFG